MKSVLELPNLLDAQSDADIDRKSLEHAKYFTIVQVRLGGFRDRRESNYTRRTAPNLAAAIEIAQAIHRQSGKTSMIYAIVDFAGARNFTRHLMNYPLTPGPSKLERDAFKAGRVMAGST